MDKRDLNKIKKGLKTDSSNLNISDVYSIYIKNNLQIIHTEKKNYNSMDEDKQELYMKSFKKVLSGTQDKNLFSLNFINGSDVQTVMHNSLKSNDIQNCIDYIISRIFENYKYETDIVLNLCVCEMYVGTKINKEITPLEEGFIPYETFRFLIGSINMLKLPDKQLYFDYTESKFDIIRELDVIVNMSTPMDGFMFPSFADGSADVNKLLYYTSKPKGLNKKFVENVFSCLIEHTAEDEVNMFQEILTNITSDGVEPDKLQEVYLKLGEKIASIEDIEATVKYKDIKEIVEQCDIDTVEVESIDKSFQMKISNIVPEFGSKSLKVKTEKFDLNIAPDYLNKVSVTTNEKGRRCISIEVGNDVELNGLKIS